MASCAYCNSTIFIGGKREGDRRYCNTTCQQRGAVADIAAQVPQEILQKELTAVHEGNCPKCKKAAGPVDVHVSYRVWSALVMTQWSSQPQISCKPCGMKSKVGDAVFSAALGWWGFPWGLLMTPIQVVRNLAGLAKSPDPSRPSATLERMVRMQLAANYIANQQIAARAAAKAAVVPKP